MEMRNLRKEGNRGPERSNGGALVRSQRGESVKKPRDRLVAGRSPTRTRWGSTARKFSTRGGGKKKTSRIQNQRFDWGGRQSEGNLGQGLGGGGSENCGVQYGFSVHRGAERSSILCPEKGRRKVIEREILDGPGPGILGALNNGERVNERGCPKGHRI